MVRFFDCVNKMDLLLILLICILVIFLYFLLSSSVALLLAKYPRDPVDEKPDWGFFKEYRILTRNNKKLECWVVYPDNMKNIEDTKKLKENPAIILLHGWGRSRGRMISRARMYGRNGYTTILLSVRDHGDSEKELLGMSILRFSQDLEACLKWWGKPAILLGHSIGAGASLLVAARNQRLVNSVIAESTPYAFPYSLKYVYRPALGRLTTFLIPGITFITLLKFRNFTRKYYSPLDASSDIICPVLLIHGKRDQIFPYKYAERLQNAIGNHCKVWISEEMDHSNIENHPDYEKNVMEFLAHIED